MRLLFLFSAFCFSISLKSQIINSVILNSKITLEEIRSNNDVGFTSSVLVSSEAKKFISPASNGFYGIYYGYELNTKKDPVKYQIVIWDNKKPWKSGSKSQQILEVFCTGNKIKIHNSLGVGISLNELEHKIGKPTFIIKNYRIYTSSLYTYSFKIVADTVHKFKLGQYKTSISKTNCPDFLCNF